MQSSHPVIGFGLALLLGSPLALAAPAEPRPGPRGDAQPVQHQYRQRPPPAQAQPVQAQRPTPAGRVPVHSAPQHRTHSRGSHSAHGRSYGYPPANFQPVRLHIHQQRHLIGRGPELPRHVHVVRGRPLPPGWGQRLSRHQARHVPHYHGYEWRRTGSDMILVAVATGLVYEILHDVLR